MNIGAHLPRTAARSPRRTAIVEPDGRRTSYAELDQRAGEIAAGLCEAGLAAGDRVAVFVRPGRDLVAIAFALFRIGASPVLLDPGMGREAVVAALAKVAPRGFVGVPLAQLLRRLYASRLPSIEISIATRRAPFSGGIALAELVRSAKHSIEPLEREPDDEAAILFTSGSTGPAKGVVYTHANFAAQIELLKRIYSIEAGEVDLACFPLFALFDAALDTTTVFAPLDASHPGRCDPAAIARAAETNGATYSFGSPAIWTRVAPWCRANGVRLESMRRVLIAGAPVSPSLISDMRGVLSAGADVHTPYGATECLPVSSIRGAEIEGDVRARSESGSGNCIGRAAPGIEVALLPITDAPIAIWSEDLRLAPGELGEICVRGPIVTREYANEPELTRAAKISSGKGPWHRMGDVGYFDDEGRLWFCGRKSHRLETASGIVPPVPTENVYNAHPRVARTALVGSGARGQERAVLVVEPSAGAMPRTDAERARFGGELDEIWRTRSRPGVPPLVPASEVRFRRELPVDVRHNAKIERGALKRWVESNP